MILGSDFDPDSNADEDIEKIDDNTFADHYTVGKCTDDGGFKITMAK